MNTKIIRIYKITGPFAENKDFAREIRVKTIIPSLEQGGNVTIDFTNVDSATQSFIHALVSDLIRRFGVEILDRIFFKNCNATVQGIIRIVVEYMQI